MFTYGKELKQKKDYQLKDLYSQINNSELPMLLLPKDKTLTIEYYIKECGLNNALVKEFNNYYAIILARKYVRANRNLPNQFLTSMILIKDNNIKKINSCCWECKNKLKGIVGECIEHSTYNHSTTYPRCEFDFSSLPETTIDLSNKYLIKVNNLNTTSPFLVRTDFYSYYSEARDWDILSETEFTMKRIKSNKQLYRDKAKTSKRKKEKIEKYCSKCIFQCETRRINTINVTKKCCLTYEQAIKKGFFKKVKFLNSTSIYRQGAFINLTKMKGWNGNDCYSGEDVNSFALTENEFNKEGE